MATATATAAPSAPSHLVDSPYLIFVRVLGHLSFILGFASIIASILIWQLFRTPDDGHGERLSIFVGLWAPTFFILSDRLDRYGKLRHA